jgi:serine protease AprX
MSKMNERGARSDRSSALWGTGGRGGDRSSVLWGKGGRSVVVSFVLALALALPLAATASPGKKPAPPAPPTTTQIAPDASNGHDRSNFVARGLLNRAAQSPNARVDVIITSTGGEGASQNVLRWLALFAGQGNQFLHQQNLSLVNGVSLSLPARLVTFLQNVPGLTVIPDSPVKLSGSVSSSTQLWPYASGNSAMWLGDQVLYGSRTPAIAVIDSGVQPRADFGTRIRASVNLSTIDGNTSLDDQDGHGTFVAGIAAGAGAGLAGADPVAPIVSIKVMDSQGEAKTSDVIAACQWILDHKDQYNIRVANFSLHSSYSTNFYRDPLDQAVEKLWFNGVTVVAASGNYGTSTSTPSGVLYSPGNDPFVITVGATDLNGTAQANDDQAAPWSAWGYTPDGFFKPEISAPGRYMVGPTPAGSTITQEKPGNLVGPDKIQLSGTSFSAPVVSGTVAEILARHPDWTPDEVKGALMKTARRLTAGNPQAAGLGELTATRAAALTQTPPNANLGLDRFVSSAVQGASGLAFDAMSWANTAKSDMSWNSMSWSSQSWSDMSWTDQSWASMSWTDMSWSDMSWTDMSWTDMSSADVSREDAAESDSISGSAGYAATPDQVQAAETDPDQVPVDNVSP